MGNIISNSRLNHHFKDAYKWLLLKRSHHPSSSDVWDFRRNWKEIKESVIKDFAKGSYVLSVQKKIILSEGKIIALWTPCDALVIKVLS